MELFEHGSTVRTPITGKGVFDLLGEEPAGGLVFLATMISAVVVLLVLIGVGVVPDARPPAMSLAIAPLFGLLALWIWWMVVAGVLSRRRRARVRAAHPHEPAFEDYPWDPDGVAATGWRGSIVTLGWMVLVTLTLASGHYAARFSLVPEKVHLVLGFLDLIALFVWRWALVSTAWVRKFGRASLAYTACPYRPGTDVLMIWRPGKDMGTARHGSFALRCLVRGEDGWRCVWMHAWSFAAPTRLRRELGVELRFTLPDDAASTELSAAMQVYWELEVKLDFVGLDFTRAYVVPVYR